MAIKDLIVRGYGAWSTAARVPARGFGAPAVVPTVHAITWGISADFDRDTVYEFDLRPYIDDDSTVSIKRGVNADGTPLVSEFEVELNNSTGIFSNRYASSSLHGLLRPDVPIRITADNGTVSGALWTGYAKSWKSRYNGGVRNRCTLTAQDIQGAYLQTSGMVNVTADASRDTDAALTEIMDALGLTVTTDYVFEDGLQALPYHFASNQKALDAIFDAVRAEMGGILFVDASGVIQFQNRAHRLGVSGAAQWGDGSMITPDFNVGAFDIAETDQDLVDEVTVIGTVYRTDYPDQRVWELLQSYKNRPTANSISIPAGQTIHFRFDLPSPALALTTPAARVDYLANDAQNNSGTDRTSSITVDATLTGASVDAAVTNTFGSAVYLTYLGFRAQPVTGIGQQARFSATKSIPNAKSARGIALNVPFVGIDDQAILGDYAVGTLITYRQSYPVVTLPFSWLSDDVSSAMIAVELGDQARYTNVAGVAELVSNLDEWFYVVAIQHKFTPGRIPVTVLTLEPTSNYWNLDAIEYDWFSRADASGSLGSTTRGTDWADDTGFDIVSNKARPNNTSGNFPSVDIGVTDMRVQTSLSNLDSDASALAGVNFRKQNATNHLTAYVDTGNELVVLVKQVAGANTTIAQTAWTPTDTAEVMVIAQGDRIRVFVDGIQYIDTTTSQFNTQTKAGLFGQTTTTVLFDDWAALGLSA